MPLNINDPEADRLVAELSVLTGETETEAVVQALRERLVRQRRRQGNALLSAELLEIGRRCAARGRHDTRDHGELLYDERGLPG